MDEIRSETDSSALSLEAGDRLAAAIEQGGRIKIPAGEYAVRKTLLAGSETEIEADKNAHIYCADGSCTSPDSFLLANADPDRGNTHIKITGGIWDGNNQNNHRKGGIFDLDSNSGHLLRFMNVAGLEISDVVCKNAESYNIALCCVENFKISDVRFDSDVLTPNQDGVHLAGYCENGVIERLRAPRAGSPNDDMIAFNADDCMTRLTNIGLCCGPIRNIRVRDISAADCHTFLRFLSVTSEISDIDIDGVEGGFRVNAINMDAARYCAAPLFCEDDVPNGVGLIKNVRIRNMRVHKTRGDNTPVMRMESNMRSFEIENFVRERALEPANAAPTVQLRNMLATSIRTLCQASDISVLGKRESAELDGDEYALLAFDIIR